MKRVIIARTHYRVKLPWLHLLECRMRLFTAIARRTPFLGRVKVHRATRWRHGLFRGLNDNKRADEMHLSSVLVHMSPYMGMCKATLVPSSGHEWTKSKQATRSLLRRPIRIKTISKSDASYKLRIYVQLLPRFGGSSSNSLFSRCSRCGLRRPVQPPSRRRPPVLGFWYHGHGSASEHCHSAIYA